MATQASTDDLDDGLALEALLKANPDQPILLDGALATHLETLAPATPLHPTLWSAATLHTNPSLIEAAHADYFRAGATVAITASYQASVPGLRTHLHLPDDAAAAALIGDSVALARNAAARVRAESPVPETRLLVAASIGPYGACLADGSEYTASYAATPASTPDTASAAAAAAAAAALETRLRAFHAPRIRALAAARATLFALETQPCALEVRALLSLLAEHAPDAKAWVTFVVDAADATRLPDGTRLADAVRALDADARVLAVGVNCVAPEAVAPALRVCAAATRKPLVAYPNSGEAWDATRGMWAGRRLDRESADDVVSSAARAWASMVRSWLDIGARLVGGCCRTGPADVRALSGLLRLWEEDQQKQRQST